MLLHQNLLKNAFIFFFFYLVFCSWFTHLLWFLRTFKSLQRLKTTHRSPFALSQWLLDLGRRAVIYTHAHVFILLVFRTSATSTLVSAVSKHTYSFTKTMFFFVIPSLPLDAALCGCIFFFVIVVVFDAVLLLMNSYTYWNELTIAYGKTSLLRCCCCRCCCFFYRVLFLLASVFVLFSFI